ncbi:CZB domain-containing protein, partial [Thermodesulfobacteriota bacterium]
MIEVCSSSWRHLKSGKLKFRFYCQKIDIGNVKATHLGWRTRLEAVLMGKAVLRPEEVASHHECDFGKWYFSPKGQELSSSSHFSVVGEHHEKVHKYAKEIVEFTEKGEKD